MSYGIRVPNIGDTVYFRLGETNTLDDVRKGTVVLRGSKSFTVVHAGYSHLLDCDFRDDYGTYWTKIGQYTRLAADHNTPASTLVELMNLHADEVDRELAGNPNTPREVLLHLAENININLCTPLAENPNSDTLILEHVLGRKEHARAFAALAVREDLPEYMYEQLVKTGIVLTHLASNKAVPVRLMIETMAQCNSIAPDRKAHIVRDILAFSRNEEYVAYICTVLGEGALSMPQSWQLKTIGCA